MVGIRTIIVATLIVVASFAFAAVANTTAYAGPVASTDSFDRTSTTPSTDTAEPLDAASQKVLASLSLDTTGTIVTPEPATIIVLGFSCLALLRTRRER